MQEWSAKINRARYLTLKAVAAKIHCMAQTFLIFNFGSDEDAAQQARLRVDRWRQGFRLDKKLQLKFDREATAEDGGAAAAKPAKGKAKASASPDTESKAPQKSAAKSDIRLIVRLDFSDHEKLSHQRWLERIPADELFAALKPKIVRSGDADFTKTSDQFDLLD